MKQKKNSEKYRSKFEERLSRHLKHLGFTYEPFKIDYDKLSLLLNKYPDSIAKKYLEYSLDKYKNIFK